MAFINIPTKRLVQCSILARLPWKLRNSNINRWVPPVCNFCFARAYWKAHPSRFDMSPFEHRSVFLFQYARAIRKVCRDVGAEPLPSPLYSLETHTRKQKKRVQYGRQDLCGKRNYTRRGQYGRIFLIGAGGSALSGEEYALLKHSKEYGVFWRKKGRYGGELPPANLRNEWKVVFKKRGKE